MIHRVTNFKVDSTTAPGDIDRRIGSLVAKAEGLNASALRDFRIISKSIDARRGRPQLLYTLDLDIDRGDAPAALHADAAIELPAARLERPVVIGTGPAGIFAGLCLAMAGAKPLILDRGQPVEQRYEDCERFVRKRKLNEESNFLFGEGGAGTFSDGKLYTGTRHELAAFVLDTYVKAGAPPEIRYLKRPHIGSDLLRKVAVNMRKRIESLGGEFRFGAEVTSLLVENGICKGVMLAGGEVIQAPALLLAPGLGGRKLMQWVRQQGAAYELKPFQIGCRIEHPQSFIDQIMYRMPSRPVSLGAAEYHMVARGKDGQSGVSSFCMCPGGEILNATAWSGHSLTNGMSNYARNGEFGNACLITTLPADRFHTAAQAYEFLAGLEQSMFLAGGGNYALPAQDASSFLYRREGLRSPQSSCRSGIVSLRLDELIPEELRRALADALKHFDRQYPGFVKEGKLIGLETCVSSPVRLLRDRESGMSNLTGLFPAGEGVGCAGGIMSAAVDGIRAALAILQR